MSRSLTFNLILINVIVFFLVFILGFFVDLEIILSFIGLKPADFINGVNLWTILTSMFMHGSFAHLFVNMFSLYFIGSFVERLIGKKRYLIFYLASGIFAGIFFGVLAGLYGFGFFAKLFGDSNIIGVGASGAIFGLLGLLSVLTPYNKVYLIAGPLLAIIIESSVANYLSSSVYALVSFLITIYFIFSIFSMFSFNPHLKRFALPIQLPFWLLPIVAIVPLVIIGFFINLPIGNMAHLGGLIVGLIYGFYLRKKYPNKTKMISRMFSK